MVCSSISYHRTLCVRRIVFSKFQRPDTVVYRASRYLWGLPWPFYSGMDWHCSWRDTLRLAYSILVCESIHKPVHEYSTASIFSHGCVLFHGAWCHCVDIRFFGFLELASGCTVASYSVQCWSWCLGICPDLLSRLPHADGRVWRLDLLQKIPQRLAQPRIPLRMFSSPAPPG